MSKKQSVIVPHKKKCVPARKGLGNLASTTQATQPPKQEVSTPLILWNRDNSDETEQDCACSNH